MYVINRILESLLRTVFTENKKKMIQSKGKNTLKDKEKEFHFKYKLPAIVL